jgi:RIO kinase 2
MGSKNHELVPTSLIEKVAKLRGGQGAVHRSISNLAKTGLIARVKEARYDGYRLTYGGLDYLALHAYSQRREVYSVGTRIGVGKESDIMVVADERGVQRVLKIHRLGRISFRTVKANRDYLRKGQSASWMYLSRLAAIREFSFMKVLREEGFPVPEPLGQSRHTVLMSLVDAYPLRQIAKVGDPASLYGDLIALILRLAKHGLIHGDFNEFNILIKEERVVGPAADPEGEEKIVIVPILIDFPQMVSMEHPDAEMYFDRDVACIKRYFEKRFHFVSTTPGPFYADARKEMGKGGAKRLDALSEASGFTKKMAKDLEAAIRKQIDERVDPARPNDASDDESDAEGDEESEEESKEESEEEDEQPQGATIDDETVDKMSKLDTNA